MDPQALMTLLASIAASNPGMTKGASAQGAMFAKMIDMMMNPEFQMLLGGGMSQPSAADVSTDQVLQNSPTVMSYLNSGNQTLRDAFSGLVNGQYSPQDAVELIMQDQTLNEYYNPSSGGSRQYWTSVVTSGMDEFTKARDAAVKAMADDPYRKMGFRDPSLRYGAETDMSNGMVQVPADTTYYDYIINRDAEKFSAPAEQGARKQGLGGPSNSSTSPTRRKGTVTEKAIEMGSPQGPRVTQVTSPATWDALSVADARQAFLQKQANQANAAGRTPYSDDVSERVALVAKLFGMG